VPSELRFTTSASLNTQQVIFWQQPFKAGGLTVALPAGRVGLRLIGEADITSVEVFCRAIAALPPDPDEIHLQLSALDFIDVCAARELAPSTRCYPGSFNRQPVSALLLNPDSGYSTCFLHDRRKQVTCTDTKAKFRQLSVLSISSSNRLSCATGLRSLWLPS